MHHCAIAFYTSIEATLPKATTDITQANIPKVINGCSDLFSEIFGQEAGVGARSAVGMGSLPGSITVEIEGIFELK